MRITTTEQWQSFTELAKDSPDAFWAQLTEGFDWVQKPTIGQQGGFALPDVRFYEDGRLNINANCLDRHAKASPETVALIWEPNDPANAPKQYTYAQLLAETEKAAAALRAIGIRKGDRVCIYLPMVPELAIAVLACARVGAIHSVVFGGFSATSLADRINDAGAILLIGAEWGQRGDKRIPLGATIREALANTQSIEHTVLLDMDNAATDVQAGSLQSWQDFLTQGKPGDGYAEVMAAEDPLFILYTSGSTGKPKGVVHTCGGYMVWAGYTFANVFQYERGDVFFCTADIGWITGHTYLLYGALLNGATTLMFEGIPTWPDAGRLWDVVARHTVNILYTAPTAIRSLMAAGTQYVEGKDLSTLKVIGSVGEPLNEEAWHWYYEYVGQSRCPLVDTWWQTETGGIMISGLAGISPSKPGYAGEPLPGVQAVLVDNNGNLVEGNPAQGNLCIAEPWPGMLRTTWGDHERCRQTYFATYPGYYQTGDGALRDEQGLYRITGRVDDVINMAGHRIGTAEVEAAINATPGVVESAVVGRPHPVKGQALYAYVIVSGDKPVSEKEIAQKVTEIIGPIAKPDWVQVVDALPKTRSGKIMRRILRKIAEGDREHLGDTSTLLDAAVVDRILAGRIA